MKPGLPWSIKGVDPELREAAKEAAGESGMTLGAWLNQVIAQHREGGAPPAAGPTGPTGDAAALARLEDRLAAIEGGAHALACSSGLGAITTALLAFVKSGDHILCTDSAYFPTRNYCQKVLARFGVETTYYDPLIGRGIGVGRNPEIEQLCQL